MSRRSEWFNLFALARLFPAQGEPGQEAGASSRRCARNCSAPTRWSATAARLRRLTGLPTPRSRDLLLARLDDNEAVLIDACELLTAAARENRRISPAAEWLLDNFYLIEEQIRTAHRHLPKGYSRELPRLAKGPSAGTPRVYDIALEAISHGDGRIDAETLRKFVASYQEVTPLKLGELWAIPIMLRLALIENLRRVGGRVIAEKIDRRLAEYWADQLMDVVERDPRTSCWQSPTWRAPIRR